MTVTISKVFETVPIVETFEASLEELEERFTEFRDGDRSILTTDDGKKPILSF